MAVQGSFGMVRFEDGLLTITLTPPTSIRNWSIEWKLQKRFGYSPYPIAVASVTSGLNNVSGINIINADQGVFTVNLIGALTSGLDAGNYVNTSVRTDSGFNTVLSEGYLQLGTTTR